MARNSEILDLVSNILDKLILSQQVGNEVMSNLKFSIETLIESKEEIREHISKEINGVREYLSEIDIRNDIKSTYKEINRIQDVLDKNRVTTEKLSIFIENMSKEQQAQINELDDHYTTSVKTHLKDVEIEVGKLSSNIKSLNVFIKKPWRMVVIISGVIIAVASAIGAISGVMLQYFQKGS